MSALSPRNLLDRLSKVAELDQNMSIQSLMTFLLVASNEGATLTELARHMGLPQSTTGRYLQDLTENGRAMATKRKSGLGLVRADVNPEEMRQKLFSLTPRGRVLLKQLVG